MSNIIELSGTDKINQRSLKLIGKSLFFERIKIVENLDYKLYVHNSNWNATLVNVITIILTAHGNNIKLFKESIESVLHQTSRNFELILVDHGCDFELKKLMNDYFISEEKIKLITFKENLYDPKATNLVEESFSNVINAALFCSEGDYVYFLSYDDFLSDNYIELILKLFIDNPNCVVATPKVVSIDEFSKTNLVMTESLLKSNIRNKYINGIDLVMELILGNIKFAAPGGLCCYRTEIILSGGGYDILNDLSQLFKYSVLGEIGTNTNAVLYWRHHEKQTNKINKKAGTLYYGLYIDWLLHIKKFYFNNNIPKSYQKIFFEYMEIQTKKDMIISIRDSIRTGLKGAFVVFEEVIRTLPNIYLGYFFWLLFLNMPYMIYNSLPLKVKILYRHIKNLKR
jgi:glycosyltransferase involved in cell wall biosynthesis